jgi:hypothetical protein
MEPYLLSYSEHLGKVDPTPILSRVRDGEFDVVITASEPRSWRGIPHIRPDLHHAIEQSYRPFCVYSGYLLHLPKSHWEGNTLADALTGVGCRPIVCNQPSVCPTW